MYYFIEARNKEDKLLIKNLLGRPESSDISDIEGWTVDDLKLEEIKKLYKVIIYNIPERYQDCIEEFKTDYWDGEFTFEKKRWREVE